MVQELQKANQSVQSFGNSVTSLTKKAVGVYAFLKSFEAVKNVGGSVIQTAATFETLSASLETVFGSAEVANRRFQELKGFAAETPFTINQVTEAAIKMRALGLDPSIDSIKSMGNTASAMGKPLMQFVEAVADAATGEMERLKEFGIRASKEGDKFKFTFQGVEKVVRNSADEIQKYLIDLGETKFAGAIEKQAETLPGVFAQAQGAVENLAAAFAEKSGLTQAVKDSTASFTELVNKLTGKINEIGQGESIEKLQEKLKNLNNELASIQNSKVFIEGRTQTTIMINNKKKEIEAVQASIEAMKKEAEVKAAIIEEQEKKEEEAREKRKAIVAAEKAAKEAEDAQKSENKRLKELFGGEPEDVLERIENYLLTEQQLIQDAKVRDIALLEQFRNEKIISEDRFHKLRYGVAKKAADDIRNLEKNSNDQIIKDKDRFISQVLTSSTSASRALFSIQKAARIAEAVLEGKAAVVSAWRFGMSIGGPPLAAAFAAGSLAFTASNIAAIKSSGSSGSSGSATALSPSLPSDNYTPSSVGVDELSAANDEPATVKTITVAFQGEGELLPRSVLRELADELNSLEDSNVRIRI